MTNSNPFTLIANLPSSFHEVHGGRTMPRFADHEEASAWLRRMEDATLASASNAVAIYETCGDAQILADGKAYLAAHQAIVALHV